MTIHLYIDEDAMDKDLCQALQARGVDVLTALDAKMIECSDEQHLEYATEQNRVLYSFNISDFYQLHMSFQASGKAHAGIILAQQQRYSVGEQMRRLLRFIAIKPAENMNNQVEFLSAWS